MESQATMITAVADETNYATIGRRFLAMVMDSLVLLIPCAIASRMIPYVGQFAVMFFYAPVLESSPLQGTFGKVWLDIRVVDLRGNRLPFKAALLRNVLKIVSSLIGFFGFILALFTSRKQTLHDLLADTLVVQGAKQGPLFDTWLESAKNVFRPSADSIVDRNESVTSRLERLQALREKGALTEEEFEIQKRRVLGQ